MAAVPDLLPTPPRRLHSTPSQDLSLPPLPVEVSVAIMGAIVQLFAIQDEDIRAHPLRIPVAILVASLAVSLWHRSWATARERISGNITSTTTSLPLLSEEVLAAIMGGIIQLLEPIQDEDARARCLHIFVAILMASLTAALW